MTIHRKVNQWSCFPVSYYICKKTKLALLTILFTLSLFSTAQALTISENFDNGQYNSQWFSLYIAGTGPSAMVVTDHLEITLPASSVVNSSDQYGCYLVGPFIAGDYDVQVDFNLMTWPTPGGGAGIIANDCEVSRRNFGAEVYEVHFPDGTEFRVNTADTTGKLRLQKTGTTLQASYWTASGWVLFGSSTNPEFGQGTYMVIGAFNFPYQFPRQDIKVAFVNLQITYGTITENFTGNQYNTNLWDIYNYMGQGSTAQVLNDRLEGTVSGNGYANLNSWGFTLIGDFEMQVDFTLINWLPFNGTQITMGTYGQSPTQLFQVARGNYGQEVYFTYILNNWAGTGVTGPTMNGTLRMVRTGNKMEGSYWNGTDWVSIGSTTDSRLATRVGVSLSFGPYGGTYSGTPAQAAFDNIRISYTTAGPAFDNGNPGNPGPAIMDLLLN
jgi:hypothetical protein